MRVMLSSINSLRRQNDDLKNEIMIFKESNNLLIRQMNSSIKRLSILPLSRMISINGSNNSHESSIAGSRPVQEGGGTVNNDSVAINTYQSTLKK